MTGSMIYVNACSTLRPQTQNPEELKALADMLKEKLDLGDLKRAMRGDLERALKANVCVTLLRR